jgi:hypothetical protein
MAGRKETVLAALAAAALILSGCSSSSSSSGGSSSTGAGSSSAGTPSTPSSSGGSSSGGTTSEPPTGTSKTGALLERYENTTAGYRMLYPGGWHVTENGDTTRIARLGNAIVITVRPATTPPKAKGVLKSLEKQVTKGSIASIVEKPKDTKLGKAAAVRVVVTQNRPATSTTPATTLVVLRYFVFHKGKLALLSLQSPDSVNNMLAYEFLVQHFTWS